ncbi:MAG: 6,7-dimethyl-8-ribityllumazine synthase [Sulfobacillus benefaciens]|uniref:6,7-dimethyl-8-ribityllumazine synthase n=1 Tax=Sulfobacillus benefaciens TaxID=453960 RepID=A0A2T2XDA7_9FIRM|nr:MAG: 6,7-dimethyl-8-ribityllumazine synthase [Sulfobacillus benefaciens]
MAEYLGFLRTHTGQRWAIVASRFNQRITDRLVDGAVDTLIRHGAPKESIDIYWVPGAFEIPSIAAQLIKKSYAAIITLGAVIRGETPHFEFVASNAAAGIARLAQESTIPVIFGVLTTDTMAQAEDRADGKAGNKGSDAALAALEMADLLRQSSH